MWIDQIESRPTPPPYLPLVSLQPLSPLPHRCFLVVLQKQQSVSAAQYGAEITCALLLHQDAVGAPQQSPPL